MLKKAITYTDFNDESVTEEFCFHFSKAELIEMELSHPGGFSGYLRKIIDSQDGGELVAIFKKLVLDSYGKRSPDGRRFLKSEELRQEFMESPAYSEMFMEMATNADAAAAFVNGIMPPDMVEAVANITTPASEPGDLPEYPAPAPEPEPKTMTKLRAASMDPIELKERLLDGWAVVD